MPSATDICPPTTYYPGVTDPDPLALTADLLNAATVDVATLKKTAKDNGYADARVTTADVELVTSVLPTQRRVFTAESPADAVETVNALLRLAPVRPRLVPGTDGAAPTLQMHAADEAFGLVFLSEFSLAAAQLAATGQIGRLRRCEATDCELVFVDRSRSRVRRYCDTRTCGNRMNVAAYRRRQRADT
jgi:predicted RNA-binding Zn ribbon-like protein